MALRYKFIELSIVTDETLEASVNDWIARGWELDEIRFVTSDRSPRPAMAFLSFTRPAESVAPAVVRPSATGTVNLGPPHLGPPHLVVAEDNDVD